MLRNYYVFYMSVYENMLKCLYIPAIAGMIIPLLIA